MLAREILYIVLGNFEKHLLLKVIVDMGLEIEIEIEIEMEGIVNFLIWNRGCVLRTDANLLQVVFSILLKGIMVHTK